MTSYEVKPFDKADLQAFPDVRHLVMPDVMPGHAFTARQNGRIIACGGVVTKHPGVGEAWLMIGEGIVRHAFFVAKHVRTYLADIIAKEGYRRVQMTIDAGNKDLLVWSHFLGMTIEGCMRAYGADGSDHYMCARLSGETDGT